MAAESSLSQSQNDVVSGAVLTGVVVMPVLMWSGWDSGHLRSHSFRGIVLIIQVRGREVVLLCLEVSGFVMCVMVKNCG